MVWNFFSENLSINCIQTHKSLESRDLQLHTFEPSWSGTTSSINEKLTNFLAQAMKISFLIAGIYYALNQSCNGPNIIFPGGIEI